MVISNGWIKKIWSYNIFDTNQLLTVYALHKDYLIRRKEHEEL